MAAPIAPRDASVSGAAHARTASVQSFFPASQSSDSAADETSDPLALMSSLLSNNQMVAQPASFMAALMAASGNDSAGNVAAKPLLAPSSSPAVQQTSQTSTSETSASDPSPVPSDQAESRPAIFMAALLGTLEDSGAGNLLAKPLAAVGNSSSVPTARRTGAAKRSNKDGNQDVTAVAAPASQVTPIVLPLEFCLSSGNPDTDGDRDSDRVPSEPASLPTDIAGSDISSSIAAKIAPAATQAGSSSDPVSRTPETAPAANSQAALPQELTFAARVEPVKPVTESSAESESAQPQTPDAAPAVTKRDASETLTSVSASASPSASTGSASSSSRAGTANAANSAGSNAPDPADAGKGTPDAPVSASASPSTSTASASSSSRAGTANAANSAGSSAPHPADAGKGTPDAPVSAAASSAAASTAAAAPVVTAPVANFHQSEPIATPQTEAPLSSTPVETVAPAAPKPAAAPLQDVSLEVGQAGAEKVEIRMVQQAGELQVAVRTGDSDLSHGLQQGLSDLVGRLQESGFHAEAWRPGGPDSPSGAVVESKKFSQDSQGADSQRDNGGGARQESGQRQQNPSRRPAWVDELEARLNNQNPTGESYGFRS